MSRLAVAFVLTALASSAHAATPVLVSQEGYLVGANDAPVSAVASLGFRLYGQASGGSSVWDEAYAVSVAGGYYAVLLGDTSGANAGKRPLLDTELAGDRWIALSVDGGPELAPRIRLARAVSAAHALTADVALDAEKLGGAAPAAFHDAAQLTGTVPAAALANAVQAVTGTAPIVATPTGTSVALSIPVATSTANGYLAASDWQAFDGKASATDPRFTNARDPTPGSANYLQNGTTAQTASFNVTGTGQVGGNLLVGGNLTVTGTINGASGVGLANSTLFTAASAPACGSGTVGFMYFNTTSHRVFVCDGAVFRSMQMGQAGDIMSTSFTLTSDSNTGGSPSYLADKTNITSASNWPSYCLQTNGTNGLHWVQVDFGIPRYISAFGIGAYPGGSHKPVSTFSLQASNNASTWVDVWTGSESFWPADTGGTYPPRYTLNVTTPGEYRYYRVASTNWTNGYMLICDWAMYD